MKIITDSVYDPSAMGIPYFPLILPLMALVGLIVLCTAAIDVRSRKIEGLSSDVQMAIKVLAGLMFVAVGGIGSVGIIWSAYNFRTIDIASVTTLKVIRSKGEGDKDNSNFVYFRDTAAIQSGLKTLSGCTATLHNHESFLDGYKLQLIFADQEASELYLSVYRRSTGDPGKAIVMPHYYVEKNLNLGDYNCPEFQEWVKTNIDPLFVRR